MLHSQNDYRVVGYLSTLARAEYRLNLDVFRYTADNMIQDMTTFSWNMVYLCQVLVVLKFGELDFIHC